MSPFPGGVIRGLQAITDSYVLSRNVASKRILLARTYFNDTRWEPSSLSVIGKSLSYYLAISIWIRKFHISVLHAPGIVQLVTAPRLNHGCHCDNHLMLENPIHYGKRRSR